MAINMSGRRRELLRRRFWCNGKAGREEIGEGPTSDLVVWVGIGAWTDSLVPAMKVLFLLRPNLLPMIARRGVVLRRHV